MKSMTLLTDGAVVGDTGGKYAVVHLNLDHAVFLFFFLCQSEFQPVSVSFGFIYLAFCIVTSWSLHVMFVGFLNLVRPFTLGSDNPFSDQTIFYTTMKTRNYSLKFLC